MHFVLMHVFNEASPGEEVILLVPGEPSKTAIAVPLDALPNFLPILERARSGLPPACCPNCSVQLPAQAPATDVDTTLL